MRTSLRYIIAGFSFVLSGSLLGSSDAPVVVSPKAVGMQVSDEQGFQWQLELLLENRLQTLLLNPSSLLSESVIVDGSSNSELSNELQVYTGRVGGVDDSWVRLTVNSQGAIRGAVYERDHYYEIHPQSVIRNRRLAAGYAELPYSGTDKELSAPTPTLRSRRTTRESIAVSGDLERFLAVGGAASQVAHIGIVVDSLFDEQTGGQGLDVAVSAINAADGLFRRQFGIALRLDTILIMTDPLTDPLVFDGLTSTDLLLEFRDFRRQSETLAGNLSLVHFFTGNESQDQNIGLAFIGSACRDDGYDVSLSVPFRYPVLLAAHEIGHNLGALHDENTDCSAETNRIMFSQISGATTDQFSSCSVSSVQQRLALSSACHSQAIDVQLTAEPLETDVVQLSASNLDEFRNIGGMQLRMDLTNATFTELPAECDIEDAQHASCPLIPLAAGAETDFTLRFLLSGNADGSLTAQLRPEGFIDLIPDNNEVTISLPLPAPTVNPQVASGGGGGTVHLSALLAGLIAWRRRKIPQSDLIRV